MDLADEGVVEEVIEDPKGTIHHDRAGNSGTKPGRPEGQQTDAERNKSCALAINLMEEICENGNLNRAYKRVKANRGSAGVDGITVDGLPDYIRAHREQIGQSLLLGTYEPAAVRKVMIPKPGGGERQLGIPTVLDRVIQQGIHQILEPIFDKDFSESSFGFRPNRSAHDALKQAKKYVEEGYIWVVDIDLEKFFDRVNHDILMSRLARKIGDKTLLRLIRRYLTAGMMENGVIRDRQEGTPQGGPFTHTTMLQTI